MLPGTGALPWRLTKEAIKVIDARIENIVYPHGPAGCSKDGAGFMKNLNRARRISQKLLGLLTILPTVLRDYVPEVREGIRKFVLGMKLLEGRCVNAMEAMELGVPADSRPLLKEDIKKAELLIIEGLSMLEGAFHKYCQFSMYVLCRNSYVHHTLFHNEMLQEPFQLTQSRLVHIHLCTTRSARNCLGS